MEILPAFLAYARDFEKTLADDDWSRLRPHFGAAAVYEVQAPSFGCRLVGPDAIFAGMKKSLDGFDRKFDGRDIAVTEGPDVDGDELRMAWEVTYRKEGWPPFVLRGRSAVRYAGGTIASLVDSYDAGVAPEFERWQRETGVRLDPSYA